MTRRWNINTELMAARRRVSRGIVYDRQLVRAMSDARRCGDEREKSLALDLFVLRTERHFGGGDDSR